MFKRIGILGGGQLGRMLVSSSIPLDMDVWIMENSHDCPSAQVTPNFILGDITNYEDVIRFGQNMDVLTIEIENVNVEALKHLKEKGKLVYPDPEIIEMIKDKGLQKQYYYKNNLPTSTFNLWNDKAELLASVENGTLQLPFVQKLRKEGYDGRGVLVVTDREQLKDVFDAPSFTEPLVNIAGEYAVIVARNASKDISVFPVVEQVFHPEANLLDYLISPSALAQHSQEAMQNIAIDIVEKMDFVGIIAIEFFICENGEILINEAAPRPHNSGHHTIESCNYSQYDIHLRAILDLPLPKIVQHHYAIMKNLVGSQGYVGDAKVEGLNEVLNSNSTYLHLYGKKETKPMRKMGHITFTGKTYEDVLSNYNTFKDTIKIISQ